VSPQRGWLPSRVSRHGQEVRERLPDVALMLHRCCTVAALVFQTLRGARIVLFWVPSAWCVSSRCFDSLYRRIQRTA
jgi:hypothetical protein